jgi:hypothetical protein
MPPQLEFREPETLSRGGYDVGAIQPAKVGALTNVMVSPVTTTTGLMPEPGSTGPVYAPGTGSFASTKPASASADPHTAGWASESCVTVSPISVCGLP